MIHIYSNLIDTPLETLIERIAALPVDRMFINNPYTPAGKLRAALAALPAGTCFTNHQLTPEATLSQALTALAPNVEHRNIDIPQFTQNPARTLSSTLHSSEMKRKQSEINTSSALSQVTLSSQTLFSPTSIEEQTDLELCKKPKC